jgi:hypothetical protein
MLSGMDANLFRLLGAQKMHRVCDHYRTYV